MGRRAWYLFSGSRRFGCSSKESRFLHLSGREIRDIYKTLKQGDDPYEKICQKLTDYFRPRKNLTDKRFQFKQAMQNIVYISLYILGDCQNYMLPILIPSSAKRINGKF